MHKRLNYLGALTVFAIFIASSSTLAADAAAQSSKASTGPYGVGVTPAVYLVNFMLMYIASPDTAAKMPAFRAPVPVSLADCLHQNPQGCPYSDFATSFDDQPFRDIAVQGKTCALPTECRTSFKYERLAPRVVKHARQINKALGMRRANWIAQKVGIDKSMILTDEQWECTRGVPPWPADADKKIISVCVNNLTNSNGNTNIPLSSHGLAITRADFESGVSGPDLQRGGDVQSLCAPEAPCLVFNDLFGGPLERIALACGWEDKLISLFELKSFQRVIADGSACQEFSGTPTNECLVEPVCP
tara:strand:- start:41193 stop:42101 length:909 start_codon:yes stop_codon:yes gene_type:complete